LPGSQSNRIVEKPVDVDGEEMRTLAYSDELSTDLVAYDFVLRGRKY